MMSVKRTRFVIPTQPFSAISSLSSVTTQATEKDAPSPKKSYKLIWSRVTSSLFALLFSTILYIYVCLLCVKHIECRNENICTSIVAEYGTAESKQNTHTAPACWKTLVHNFFSEQIKAVHHWVVRLTFSQSSSIPTTFRQTGIFCFVFAFWLTASNSLTRRDDVSKSFSYF